ncbi:dual specificity calcium/calmodulin-dependent 3',5'-cyclic nucleotide phosphodiesterase 1-like isoform X3 [Neocloeon triangulifer]|uniref:dual specificity calcium/calmodulin-dependent 3',5'-cyclic nucleotide phosphodiesterase 1-like isoform X3 n=1 Tax=Neocloeon triangulifer TaxID=2078957 RepID=UPI00286ECC9E|nr:dual specificity calcium/calmodulin-dependent 3',5'-cyclic nucleotide phosphodiesterase 1-like isoform X3 [Neocloeon triangulifer]
MGTVVSLPETARKVLLCSEAPMPPNGPQEGFAGATNRFMQAFSPARAKRQGGACAAEGPPTVTSPRQQQAAGWLSSGVSPQQSTQGACNPDNNMQDSSEDAQEQGSLTIVRRSSGKAPRHQASVSSPPPVSTTPPPFTAPDSPGIHEEAALEAVDLAADNLPSVDTPDACDKAALRLRCLLKQLHRGEVPVDLLRRNLQYAARVLEAVYIDETKAETGGCPGRTGEDEGGKRTGRALLRQQSSPPAPLDHRHPAAAPAQVSTPQGGLRRRRLRAPVWARRLADEDDELSEVQPDAVPHEVREWLASTFTRQLASQRRRADEKPKFRSVAHAIRAGIFVDRIYRRMSSAPLMQFPPEVARALKTLDDWTFDVFALSEAANGQPVKYLGYDLLNRYGIIHKFKVQPQTLENFLCRVEEGYCKYKNPYHNNLHAADVAQTVHYMLCQTGLMNWLSDLEIFATLVAAVVHDLEHTGTTNNFHVMAQSDTALLYNDRAVLENHHASATFRILKEEENNILSHLSREEYREFRTLVIDMVLATDMSFHFQQLKNMRNLLTLAEPSIDKSKALSLVLHCCDISHPAKRWTEHHQWTSLLLEEFFLQGDKESELGLPFSPLCDRNNTLVAESQIGFIEFIVEPSMGVCSDMLDYILAPLNASSAGSTQPSTTSIIEEGEENSSASSTAQSPAPFVLKKPWVSCLSENKRSWKDQAVKDADARALQKKLEEEAAAAAAEVKEPTECPEVQNEE